MEIKTTFPLKDGRTAVILKDAFDPDFAIVSGYDSEAPIGDQWDGSIYFDGNKEAFFNAVLSIETSASFKDYFDVVLLEKPVSSGLGRREVNTLIGMLDEESVEPISLEALEHEAAAMGFITVSAAEELGYCFDGLRLFLAEIMDGLEEESADGAYEYEGLQIYLGRTF